MATINELMEKYSKVPGDLKLRYPLLGKHSWFIPYFYLHKDKAWHGITNYSDYQGVYQGDADTWELWQEPKKKKKVAPYLMRRKDNLIVMTHTFYETDEAATHDWEDAGQTTIRRMTELEVEVEE